MFLQILLLILGFGLLIKGADWMVNGASALARKYNISNLAIGLTVVAFGTSAPELVVNAFASYQNHHQIVFGNIIGSNNINLFVILGIAGLISPLFVQSSTVWKEIPISFFAIVVLFFLVNGFLFTDQLILTRIHGLILLVLFGVFLFYVYTQLKNETVIQLVEEKHYTTLKIWVLIIVGLSLLVIGGKLIVNNAVLLAKTMGISETIISLTIVALGTSLPELATSVIAALKKNNDIAVGNIIGSNIFNIFFILGISSLIRPVVYDPVFNKDLYLLAAGTIILFLFMFTGIKKKLDRWEAGVLLLIYIVYTIYLIN